MPCIAALIIVAVLLSGCGVAESGVPAVAPAPTALPTATPHVVAETVYEPLREPPIALTPVPDVFLPQFKITSSMFMQAQLRGELVVENGCLRVRTGTNTLLVIWQPDFFLNDNAGTVEVVSRLGEEIGRVGETIEKGGGGMSMTPELMRNLREPLPEQCGGPYWLAGHLSQPGQAVP